MAPGEEQAEELALLVEKLAPAESLVEVDHEDPLNNSSLMNSLSTDSLILKTLSTNSLLTKSLSTNSLMQTSFTKYLILTLSCKTSS